MNWLVYTNSAHSMYEEDFLRYKVYDLEMLCHIFKRDINLKKKKNGDDHFTQPGFLFNLYKTNRELELEDFVFLIESGDLMLVAYEKWRNSNSFEKEEILLLLSKGFNLNKRYFDGKSFMHLYVSSLSFDLDFLEFLVSQGFFFYFFFFFFFYNFFYFVFFFF